MAIPVLGVLFAKGARTEIIGAPQEIPVDCYITREHAFSSSITREPVEDGSDINDHVVLDTPELTIEGVTSDHPVSLLATLGAVTGAVSEFLGLSGAEMRSQTAAKALKLAWSTKAELEIVTKLGTYKNMVIDQLVWTESVDVGEALSFRMHLVHLEKVSLVLIPTAGLGEIQADLASGPVEAGRQATKAPPRPAPAAVTSLSQAAAMAG